MVRLSALCTGRLYPQGNIPGTHFCYRLSRPQGHNGWKEYVNEKFQWHHRESNSRPSGWKCGASTPTPPRTPWYVSTIHKTSRYLSNRFRIDHWNIVSGEIYNSYLMKRRYSTCTLDHTQRATVSLASACTARRTESVSSTKTNQATYHKRTEVLLQNAVILSDLNQSMKTDRHDEANSHFSQLLCEHA